MKIIYYFAAITFAAISLSVNAQVNTLSRIGQTPGGAAHHVNWIEDQQILIVGCGGSLWVYNVQDPENPEIIAKRAFMQLIEETDVYGNILFATAENDGLYALDFTSDSLTILHTFKPLTFQFSGEPQLIYDFSRRNDTLFVPVASDFYKSIRIVTYDEETGFTEHYDQNIQIGEIFNLHNGARCIAVNDDYIAVGKQKMPLEAPKGEIFIFERQFPYNIVGSIEDSLLNNVQKVRFADLRNDILYTCAGSNNAGLTSYFFAYQIDESNIFPVDTFAIGLGGIGLGLPIVSAVNIKNMDSRNDTLYLATTCWVDTDNYQLGENFSFIPILDASGLPETPMSYDSHLYGGLWHFDLALMHGTPYMAIASEWLGFLISDITDPDNPLDTLSMNQTGGWVQHTKTTGDTLWVASEGWGLAVYKSDSLLFEHGYNTESMIMHKYVEYPGHYFVSDFEFLQDTLLYLASGHIFNLKPWFEGGETELVGVNPLGLYVIKMTKIATNLGTRLILGKGVWLLSDLEMSIYDPDSQSIIEDNILLNSDPNSIAVENDVFFYPYRTAPYLQNGELHLVAAKIIDDERVILKDTILNDATIDIINAIDVENNIVVIGQGATFSWFNWNGESFVPINSFTHTNVFETASGVEIKNSLIYASYRYDGLKVINSFDAIELAYFEGSGGYDNSVGSGNGMVTVGNDGKIYLSDFYSGIFIIEAADISLKINEEYIKEQNQNSIFSIYPNPTKDLINISSSGECDYKNIKICVRDITGKTMLNLTNNQSTDISFSTVQWPAGLYFVNISDDLGHTETLKIIVTQ
jgi:hypothetical protein